MSKKEQIIQLEQECYSYSEIARIAGVSRQYVSQVFCKCGLDFPDFRKLSDKECIYAGLRKWWNENRMTYPKFIEAMGMCYHDANLYRLKRYFTGESNPRKDYIDKLIAVTGLTYEQLFYGDGD